MAGDVLVGPFPPAAEHSLRADSDLMERLSGVGDVRFTSHPAESPEFSAAVRGATAVLGIGPYPAAAWDDAPLLRLVSIVATGYESFIDVAGTQDRGIDIAYVPAYGAEAIAEHGLALVLALAKNVVADDAALRAGRWRTSAPSVRLSGGVAGVIGLGPVGRHMARLLSAMGMEVLVWTRSQDPARLEGTGARFAPLKDVIAAADVISVHLALAPGTVGFLDAELLGGARRGAILVNTARAEVVAPGALEDLVRSGHLRAGIDVFRQEPPTSAEPLLALGRDVVLTPHTAFNTVDASRAVLLGAAANVADYFAGRPTSIVPRRLPE